MIRTPAALKLAADILSPFIDAGVCSRETPVPLVAMLIQTAVETDEFVQKTEALDAKVLELKREEDDGQEGDDE